MKEEKIAREAFRVYLEPALATALKSEATKSGCKPTTLISQLCALAHRVGWFQSLTLLATSDSNVPDCVTHSQPVADSNCTKSGSHSTPLVRKSVSPLTESISPSSSSEDDDDTIGETANVVTSPVGRDGDSTQPRGKTETGYDSSQPLNVILNLDERDPWGGSELPSYEFEMLVRDFSIEAIRSKIHAMSGEARFPKERATRWRYLRAILNSDSYNNNGNSNGTGGDVDNEQFKTEPVFADWDVDASGEFVRVSPTGTD